MRHDRIQLRTYVRYFLSDGSYCDEPAIVRSPHVQTVQVGTFCYAYYDLRCNVLNFCGRPTAVHFEPSDWSPLYFCGGKISTVSEALLLQKYDKPLADLLEVINKPGQFAVDRVLKLNNQWYALRREDVVRDIAT